MASLIETLIDTLNRECNEYENLLELSRKKTSIIVGNNIEALQKIMDDENVVLDRLANVDKERQVATKDIANVLNMDVTTLTLTKLIDAFSKRPVERKALAEAHDNLQRVTRSLQQVNERNGELIRSSLEMVGFELNLLSASKAAPQTANYSKGNYTGAELGVTRSGFDAKQ